MSEPDISNGGMSDGGISSVVYSCTFANYDYTLGPLARTPGAQFLRFGTTRPNRHRIWQHKPIPAHMTQGTQTLTNRRFKLFPGEVLPDCDVAIYVDGNILIRTDLTPLIREFWDSGADIALFPHPSGRSLEEEIDYSTGYTIPEAHTPLVEEQARIYRDADIMDHKISENTILFYRMRSPKVAQIGAQWWDHLERFCKRDQISLPYAIRQAQPKVHYWDWHFHNASEKNIYFARSGHRATDPFSRFKSVAFFMQEFSWPHKLAAKAIYMGAGLVAPIRRLFGIERGPRVRRKSL